MCFKGYIVNYVNLESVNLQSPCIYLYIMETLVKTIRFLVAKKKFYYYINPISGLSPRQQNNLIIHNIYKTRNTYRLQRLQLSLYLGTVVVVINWIYNYLCNQCLPLKFVSSNPDYGEVYLIQHYVAKFFSDSRQINGFLRVLWFPPPIKLTATIYLKYCWKWR